MPKCVSICIPFFNEESNVFPLYESIRNVMDSTNYEWEIICVNDGSRDNTLDELVRLHKQDIHVRVFDLSRNFGKGAALTAALEFSCGDCAIPMDADMQHPPDVIPKLLIQWENGYDVVNAVRISRVGESWFKKTSSILFYKTVNRLTHVEIPPNVGDFRLLSRCVLDILRQLPERRRFMKGLFSWVGFRTTSVPYVQEARYSGKTKWNYWRLWNFAIEGITSFSQVPLQIASYLGIFVSILSLGYAFFLLVETLLFGNPVKGYPSLMVAVLFMGGVQLVFLGIIGEYLGRIYDESKRRPVYILRERWDQNISNENLGK